MQTIILQIPNDMPIDDARAACVEAIGWLAHDGASEGVDVYNAGWDVVGSEIEISICSKTSKGKLQTNYDSETGTVTNEWMDDDAD